MKKPANRKAAPLRRVTRRDVAQAAGVSLTTVTHALNNTPGTRIQPATRALVLETAKRLGYMPSFIGTALSSGKTGMYGLLLPHPQSIEYDLYAHLLHHLAKDMEVQHRHLLLLFRSEERTYLDLIRRGALEGVFIIQSDQEMTDTDAVLELGTPTVVINKTIDVSARPHAGMVQQDWEALGNRIIADFVADGRRRLLLYHDTRSCDADIVLQRGLDTGVAAYAHAGVTGLLACPEFNRLEEQVRELFHSAPNRFDGIYCAGSGPAVRVAEALRAMGLRPGIDVALIYNDILNRLPPEPALFLAGYGNSVEDMAHAAWRLMTCLPQEQAAARVVRIPHHRL